MKELLNLKVEISNLDLKENTISNLLTSANKVQEEIERLNNIIDKAIEYIEDNTYKSYETDYMDLTGIKDLLNILNSGYEER